MPRPGNERSQAFDDFPEGGDAWKREKYSRDALIRGLIDCSDDALILISDIDEIPKLETVQGLAQRQDLEDQVCVLLSDA